MFPVTCNFLIRVDFVQQRTPSLTSSTRLMVIADDAEWTTSRIKRLFRPLKCKCLALSSYLRKTSGGITTYGSRRLPLDQGLLPLEAPLNVGLRIHFSRGTVQTLELSKKILAIRDHYSDLIMKAKRSCILGDEDSPLSSLTTMCSVILGAQISCDEDQSADAECSLDGADMLYDFIPPAYRLRAFLMQALHMILDSCPPHATLYLNLFDLTLDHKLYHESEVLLDVTLDHAFELSSELLPRISNPEYRGFLVDLYCKWTTRFPASVFVRLVVGALQRAPSDIVWTTKAIRRFARKLGRYDIGCLPPLLSGLMDTILIRKKKCKGTPEEINRLQTQLHEWFDMAIDVCTTSTRGDSGTQIFTQDEPLVTTLLDCCCSWTNQCTLVDHNALSGYGFIGAFACLYTLWLASGHRTTSKYDVLYRVFRRLTPPVSSYTPLCRRVFETTTLDECQSILHSFSSVLCTHGLPRLRASLWACALYHVEESEVEQILVDRNGRDKVRDFKLRLIDYVDEAEGEISTATCSVEGQQEKKNPGRSEIPYGNEEATEGAQPAITCHPGSDEYLLSGPSKRRKTSGYLQTTPERRRSSGSPHRLSLNDNSRNVKGYRRYQDQQHGSSSHPARDHQPVSIQFASLLSDAISSRASLHASGVYHEMTQRDDSVERTINVHPDDTDDDDDDDSVYGGDVGVKELDLEQHAPSEDFLDLFRVTGTSSPVR